MFLTIVIHWFNSTIISSSAKLYDEI